MLRTGLLNTPHIHPTLITLTLSHHKGMSLSDSLTALKGSYRALIQSRSWRDLAADSGLLAMITATEILYGQNGWHTHLHAIALHDRNLTEQDTAILVNSGAKQWKAQLERNAYTASLQHGFDVSNARYSVADYVAKFGRDPVDMSGRGKQWGLEREAVKGVSKQSRTIAGRSMQAILADSRGNARSADGRLFTEYYNATFGNKLLTISKQAKELLGIDISIEDDQALIEAPDRNDILLAMLTRAQWAIILHKDRRDELLTIAALGDSDALHRYILSICPELDI